MSVRFILGRTGSGKTTACLTAIIRQSKETPLGPPLFLLVPEQAVSMMERKLAALNPRGSFRAHVCSFPRLAARLNNKAESLVVPAISETGKKMLLRRLLQEHGAEFEAFAYAAQKPRFNELLSAQLREFKNYEISPSMLQGAAGGETCPSQLSAKLSDLSKIFRSYQDFINGRLSDPDDRISALANAIKEKGLPDGTQVWVDGFTGFTPSEYTVLEALLPAVSRIEFSLCVDHSAMDNKETAGFTFFAPLETHCRLNKIAEADGKKILPPLLLPEADMPRFQKDALLYLEKNLDKLPVSGFSSQAKNIKLTAASSYTAEVEAAARDIIDNIRKKGWRLRDIVVLTRDLNNYREIIDTVFSDFDIPYYIGEGENAAHHPLVRLLCCAFEAATNGMKYEPVMQMLKTGFFPLSSETIDRVDNYALAHGLEGDRWFGETHTVRQQERLWQKERAVITELFLPFYQVMSSQGKKQGTQYCLAVWDFLQNLQVESSLQHWFRHSMENGEAPEAKEHRQAWQGVVELLEQINHTLGDFHLNAQEFGDIFTAGLEALSFKTMPEGLDQVLIGTAEKFLQSEAKAAYVIGLNDGDFPAMLSDKGLLLDNDRLYLLSCGLELAHGKEKKIYYEQYLSYMALTRSSDYLWASHAEAAEDGKGKRPSHLFHRLVNLFPHNEVESIASPADCKDNIQYLTGIRPAAACLLHKARGTIKGDALSPFWGAAYNKALSEPDFRNRLQLLWASLSDKNCPEQLDCETIRKVYGPKDLHSSVSRLELYARCPFAHFARHGLKLQDRENDGLKASDIGFFFHDALHQFSLKVFKHHKQWPAMKAEAACIMEETLTEMFSENYAGMITGSARQKYLAGQLREILLNAVARLTEHAHRGKFTLQASEASFGKTAGNPWLIAISPGNNLILSGRIDRIDGAVKEEYRYIRVIDYKSRPSFLSYKEVFYGLSLQLPAYLYAAYKLMPSQSAREKLVPAGALYFTINPSMTRMETPPLPEEGPDKIPGLKMEGFIIAENEAYELMGGSAKLVPASLKKDGTFTKNSRVLSGEDICSLLEFTRLKMAKLGAEILSGNIGINPYLLDNGENACRFCDFKPLCRFDVMNGNRYRYLPHLTEKTALAAVLEYGRQEGGHHHEC